MTPHKNPIEDLIKKIQSNCDISDARDHGIYSLCILVLKLRNLYKWEIGLNPWEEPESSDVLDWIDKRESYWATLLKDDFHTLDLNNESFDPFDVRGVNEHIAADGLFYGAGYGRSMKSVFFLAEILQVQQLKGKRVVILGSEKLRELSGPFALRQENDIIIRKEQLTFFLWDHLQEILPSSKEIILRVLSQFTVDEKNCRLSKDVLKRNLTTIVEKEIPVFIRHEIGEMQDTPLSDGIIQSIIRDFPDSLIEFFSRAVKDVLADTHPEGMLKFIIDEKREMSLGFYISFLNGIRRTLFPEISKAVEQFLIHNQGDWQTIEEVRQVGWKNNIKRAEMIRSIINESTTKSQMRQRIEKELLEPLELKK